MIKYIIYVGSILWFAFAIAGCKTIHNYVDEDVPKFMSNEVDVPIQSDEFIVSSYNIKLSQNIQEAIRLIRRDPNLSKSHIILLQEMDRIGVEQMAEQLKYNFVYYPISLNTDSTGFGNAILCKSTIYEEEKIIMPHGQWFNGRKRSVVKAMTHISGKKVTLYCGHLSTPTVATVHRLEQIDSLISHVSTHIENGEFCLVGGDFNAAVHSYRKAIIEKFDKIKFEHATSGIGETHKSKLSFFEFQLDLIFTNNMEVLDKGKVEDETISDHFPIWVKLKLKE